MKKPNFNSGNGDSVFRLLFANSAHKDWALSLLNAIHTSNVTDPELVQLRIEEDLFSIMVKDTGITIIGNTALYYAFSGDYRIHISMRILRHLASRYEEIIGHDVDYLSADIPIKLPPSKHFLLYNGNSPDIPPNALFVLSDVYEDGERGRFGEGDVIDVRVQLLSVSRGCSEFIRGACRPLEEYTWIINDIYSGTTGGLTLSEAIRSTLERLPHKFVIRDVLLKDIDMTTAMLEDDLRYVPRFIPLPYSID